MGSETYLHMKHGQSVFTAKVPGQVQVEDNTDMDVVFDVNKAHFFDAKSEETIV